MSTKQTYAHRARADVGVWSRIDFGVAVAVTDTAGVVTVAGTPADAVVSPQPVIDSHVGRFTNCCPASDSTIVGVVRSRLPYADCANSAGVIAGGGNVPSAGSYGTRLSRQ